MEYQGAVRGKKLAFKSTDKKHSGEDKPSERTRQKHKRKNRTAEKDEINGWVPLRSKSDLEGPLAIYFRSKQLHIFSLPPKAETCTLADVDVRPPRFYALDSLSLIEAEPSIVEQVFVGRRSVPATGATDEQSNAYSFKSCRDTYLSTTKRGEISCASVAIGPLEMWTPVLLPEKGDGSVALKICQPSTPGTDYFLSISALPTDREPLTPPAAAQTQSIRVHTLATSIGVNEVFTIKCQAAMQKKRLKGSGASKPIKR